MSCDWIKKVPFGDLSASGLPLLLKGSPSGSPSRLKGVYQSSPVAGPRLYTLMPYPIPHNIGLLAACSALNLPSASARKIWYNNDRSACSALGTGDFTWMFPVHGSVTSKI